MLDRYVALMLFLILEELMIHAVLIEIRACARSGVAPRCQPRAYYVCPIHRGMFESLSPCPDPSCPACRQR